MTTFSWKRKAGDRVAKDVASKFFDDAEKDVQTPSTDSHWVQSFKRKKLSLQTDCQTKGAEYKAQGIRLAEQNRFQEAVAEFDKALSIMPTDHAILEMKAQALLQLNRPLQAIEAAEKAVNVNPRWWVAYQTLGRAQLGVGDIKMAKISFSKALHLNPAEKELWEEDLNWTLNLIKKEENLGTVKEKPVDTPCITYDEEGYITSVGKHSDAEEEKDMEV